MLKGVIVKVKKKLSEMRIKLIDLEKGRPQRKLQPLETRIEQVLHVPVNKSWWCDAGVGGRGGLEISTWALTARRLREGRLRVLTKCNCGGARLVNRRLVRRKPRMRNLPALGNEEMTEINKGAFN